MKDLKPVMRAALSRAYVELETLKLRLRMSPAPKAVDVAQWMASRKRKAKPGVAEFSETDDDQAHVAPSNGHVAG